MNNVVTASRINCLETCPRQHFWRYEVGLQKDEVSLALRIGSAWARAMEVRWNGGDYDAALLHAIPDDVAVDLLSCETVAALLAAYYMIYGPAEKEGRLKPEVQLPGYEIGSTGFSAGGKMDALGELWERGEALIESKTTRCRLDDDSEYWLRLKFNTQILQYLVEARRMGHDPVVAFYDVTRKPQTRPKNVVERDAKGFKIVLDRDGNRVMKSAGKKGAKVLVPKESADIKEGQRLQEHVETPDEFGNRLFQDCMSRPEFYFKRKEIPVVDKQVERFERKREEMVGLIVHYRAQEQLPEGFPSDEYIPRDEEAWPRYVREQNCIHCNFKSFCLQDMDVDPTHPPKGFSIQPFNPELEETNDPDATTEDGTAG